MRRLAPLFLILAAAALTASCNPAADELVIGEIEAMTGNEAAFGTSTHDGILLAVEEANVAGGVRGLKLRVVTVDDQGQSDQTALAATRLITQEGARVLISGGNSTRSLAMAPIAQHDRVPFIATGATNPKVTAQGDFVFRTTFIDPFQGAVMARFAAATLGLKRVAILKDMKSDYSIGLSEVFSEAFKRSGGAITAVQTYSFGESDFKSQLTSMLASRAEGIFIPGYYTEVGLIARQARELGGKAVLLGADGWDSPKLREIAGTAIAGGYFSAQYSPESTDAHARRFVAAFKARYGHDPDASCALGYTGASVLLDALRRAKELTPPAIRDALAATRDFDSATGKIRIDGHRDAVKPAAIIRIDEKGEFRYHSSVAPN